MSATWYKTSRWGAPITEVQVEKATEHRVTIAESARGFPDGRLRQRSRQSEGEAYFATWAEAREWHVGRAGRKHVMALAAVETAARELAKAIAIPTEPPQ